VQISVLMTVELPTSGTIDTVEPRIVAAGQQAMRAAVQAACQEYERQVAACPHCHSPQLQRHGTGTRRVRTSFGRVVLQIRRLQCEACRRIFRPAAPFLAGLAGLNVTARLRDACMLAGSSWPYATAALVLHELCGAEISPESVRQLTNVAGRAEAHAQLAAATPLVTPTAALVRRERTASLAPPSIPPPPPPQLLVGLDGGWIPSRDQRGGMEGKVGVVATEADAIGRHGRHRLSRRRYVATFGDAARVGVLTYASAHALGGAHAAQQTVLGDGAAWIKTQAALHFPDATTILDWPHIDRAIHKAIRAARPGTANKVVRRQAHQAIPALVWVGDVDGAVAALQALLPTDEPAPATLTETITYLQEQRPWIGDYSTWQAAGVPIGSGMVERAVALVINRRMKRQGMRWRRDNADAVAALRVATINRTWDEVRDAA